MRWQAKRRRYSLRALVVVPRLVARRRRPRDPAQQPGHQQQHHASDTQAGDDRHPVLPRGDRGDRKRGAEEHDAGEAG